MAGRGKGRRRGDARLRVVRNDEVQQRIEVAAETQPLMAEIRTRLRNPDPLALMSFISTLVAATDGRHGFPDGSPAALDDLIDTFIDLDLPETTAALHVLAALAPGEAMRARAASALERRHQPMPQWLAELPATTVTDAARFGYVTEPGQNLLVEYRWPTGALGSYVVFDEGLSRGIKDAFPSPESLASISRRMRESAPPHVPMTYEDVDLATARATIEQGLANGANRPIDQENDTWPSGRPMVEWLLSLMPAGGVPHPSTSAPPAARLEDLEGFEDVAGRLEELALVPDPEEIFEDFGGSAPAAAIGFDEADLHDDAALQAIVDFASLLGTRDPRQWDTDRVAELLEDYLPTSFLPDPRTARRIQPVLEAFLTWSADELELSSQERSGLLRVARGLGPAYLDIALSPQAQTLRKAVADYEVLTESWDSLGVLVIGEDVPGARSAGAWSPPSREELTAALLQDTARQVGGTDALDALDATPLPDEDLDLTQVPEAVRPAVESVGRLVDAFADVHLGLEFRTAARRFLARAAAADPVIFRRAGRADTAAAAVAWTVGRGNDLVGAGGGTPSVGELLEHFGVSGSPSTRAQVFIKAVDTAWHDTAGPHLGSPDLLVSSKRSALIDVRDRIASGHLLDS